MQRSIRLVTGLLSLMLLAVAHGAAPPSDEAQLREIKLVLWPKAYREQDVALLDRVLDDGFRSIDGTGNVSTKAEELAWVKANKLSHDAFLYEIERIEIHSGTTAIVCGLGTITNKKQNVTSVSRYRSTNVFVKRGSTWRAIASHVSSLPD